MTQENKDEIIEAIHHYADQTDKKLDKLDSRMNNIEQRVTHIETTMVTKDYLDDKIADLRGDLVLITRKEDKKVNVLVDILKEKNVLNDEEVKKIIGMAPFAQIS